MAFTLKFNGPEQLCDTCAYGSHASDGVDTYRSCSFFPKKNLDPNRVRVKSCSAYLGKGKLSLFEMKRIAWIIDNDKKTGIGFIKPKDRTQRMSEDIELLDERV